jgi:hypothetical protein
MALRIVSGFNGHRCQVFVANTKRFPSKARYLLAGTTEPLFSKSGQFYRGSLPIIEFPTRMEGRNEYETT